MIELNKKELKLLYYLELNCRETIKNLSRLSGLSKNSVVSKINDFVKQGLIKDFSISLDYTKLDFSAYRVEFFCQDIENEKFEQLILFIQSNRDLSLLDRLDRNYGLSFVFIARNYKNLEDFLSKLQLRFGKYIFNVNIWEMRNFEEYPSAYLLNKAFDDSGLIYKNSENKGRNILEDKDLKILNILTNNARISLVEISKKLNMPERTAKYRLSGLEKNKIILRCRTILNKSLMGYKKVRIKIETSKPLDEVKLFLRENPSIVRFEENNLLDYYFFVEIVSDDSLMSLFDSIKEKFGPLKSYSYDYIPETTESNRYVGGV